MEEMVSKAGSKINRTEFFERRTETVVRSALRFFLPEHVSKSLTERTELIVKNLLEQADFPHRAQYPEHFVKNATALAGMAFTDLAELHDEEKRSAFVQHSLLRWKSNEFEPSSFCYEIFS